MSVNSWPKANSLPARKPRAKYQVKYLVGLALILGVIVYLIFFGISSTQQYYKQVGELLADKATLTGQGVRVGGNLVPSSINQDIKNNKINFVISDGKAQLLVSYDGVVPDTFSKATQVIAEGKLNADGTFTASTVLAKCPSKYDAASTQPSNYTWQTIGGSGK